MNQDISQKKLELIERNVDRLPNYIERLSAKRPEQYDLKKSEWTIKRNKIRNILDQKSYFLFIGRFSSGKSSFVNALMGRDILPTNSKPTTAVVTEVVFKEEGLTDGVVCYNDDERTEQKSKSEILDIIQGKTKINIGSVHHVCLSININDQEFESSKETFKPLVDKVVLVDCPGFDSPYKFSEDVLYEYVEKASFTYYFLPWDDFGSIIEIKRLRNIKKKTATLIPLISKADLMESPDEKNEKIESFEKTLADSFPRKEPIFVSTFKYKEYQAKAKEWEEKILCDDLSDEENKVLYDLEIQAGIYQVLGEMSSDAKQSALNLKKIDSVKQEFNEIVDEILMFARKEEDYWRNELIKINYDFESQEYKDLVKSNDAIKDWIENEASEVSKQLKNAIVIEVTNHLNETSHPDARKIKQIYNDCFEKVFNDNQSVWSKRFGEYFKEVSVSFNGTTEFEPPKIDFGLPGGYILDGLLTGATKSGEAVLWAAGGATLIGAESTIAGWTIAGGMIAIGTVLAPIAITAGTAFLILAGVKGFNPIRKAIKTAKENREKMIQDKVDSLLSNNTNFEAIVSKFLNDQREAVYKKAISLRESDKVAKLCNYEDCKVLHESLDTLKINLNDKIS